MVENKKKWGGARRPAPGKKLGRPKEKGYEKTTKARFMEETEEAKWNQFSPRQRVEIVLEWLAQRKYET